MSSKKKVIHLKYMAAKRNVTNIKISYVDTILDSH
jgi:hypothetical protein